MTVALLYHDVVPRGELDTVGFPGPLAARYKLEPARFEAHLEAIAATGAAIDVPSAGGELPAVMLTVDDGGASALGAAAAIERHGWRACFFITTSRIGTPGFLSRSGVAELVQRGHRVGSHSHTHPVYLGRLSPRQIEHEWRESRLVLGDLLGEPPWIASLPGGYLTRSVVTGAAGAGYRLLMTSQPTTRPRREGDLLVLGRFAISSTTTPARAAAYVQGATRARVQLWLVWQAKTLAKGASPRAYQVLRRVRARCGR